MFDITREYLPKLRAKLGAIVKLGAPWGPDHPSAVASGWVNPLGSAIKLEVFAEIECFTESR